MGRDEKIAEIGYPVEVYVWILWVWCVAVLSAAKRWPKDGRIFFFQCREPSRTCLRVSLRPKSWRKFAKQISCSFFKAVKGVFPTELSLFEGLNSWLRVRSLLCFAFLGVVNVRGRKAWRDMNGDWRSVFWGALPGEFWHSGGHTRMWYWYWCWYRYLMNFILEKVHQVLQLSTTWWVPWLTMGWKIVPKPTMDDMALLLSTKGCGEKTWNQCQASLEMSTDGSHQYEKAGDCFLLVNYWDWCWLGFC